MIVRRITAGAAGLALVGTAFAAAPAMAKNNTTTLKLDSGLVAALGDNGVVASAVKPAKLKKTTISFPVKKYKKSKIKHTGALQLTVGDDFVTMGDITINTKTGKAAAAVDSSLSDLGVVKNLLILKGGKNKLAKNGTWKGAKVSFTKEDVVAGTDPASALNDYVFGGQVMKTGQRLGTVNIKIKVKK